MKTDNLPDQTPTELLGDPSTTTVMTPITPDQEPPSLGSLPLRKLSKRKIIFISIATVVFLLSAGGSVALAKWYNNPNKVIADAFSNLITSRIIVADAKIDFSNGTGSSKTSGELTLSPQINAADVNGQLDAKLTFKPSGNTAISFSGSGMISNTGTIYFKLDNVSKILSTYFESVGTSSESLFSPQLKSSIEAFAKKIDGQWIKVETSDLKSIWKDFDYAKAKQCYQKVYDDLSKNPAQKNQLYDLYQEHPFLNIKQHSSEKIDQIDSIKYSLGINMSTYYDALIAFENTDYEKTTNVCDKSLQDKPSMPSKPAANALKEEQKLADQTQVNMWVSRWKHELVRTSFDVSDSSENAYQVAGTINFKQHQTVNITNPKTSLPLKDLQAELEKIMSELYVSIETNAATSIVPSENTQPTAPSTPSENAVTIQSQDSERKADINSLYNSLEAYYASNGHYPTLAEINDNDWREENNVRIDGAAFKDPIGTVGALTATPQKAVYSYQPTNDAGRVCPQTSQDMCAAYTLTAILSDGTAFTQTSLE